MLTESQLDAIAERIADRVAEKLQAKLSVKWVTREQYSQMTSLSVSTIDRMVKDGRVRFKRAGRRVLIQAP